MLVALTVQRHGLDGLILATFLAGLILLAIGLLRLGVFIKYIPYPVTVGFTAGIAITIFASQIKDLFGLTLAGAEPAPFLPKMQALFAAAPTVNVSALAIAALSILIIAGVRRFRPLWPAFLIATVIASLLAWKLHLPIETLGSKFGGIPRSLPVPHLPVFSLAKVQAVLPAALSFALLGSIESLLSAVVADSMTGRRHRSNIELVAQGAANMASALFGGICVTGTIARTATNVRAGGRSPISGMLHAAFVLLFMLVAAPLASYIPLAALAGLLAVVCWNMAEKHEFAVLLRASRADAAVLLATFLLVVFRDLTQGILVGFGLGVLLFLHRMAGSVEVAGGEDDGAYDEALITDPDVAIYKISGAFFFGAAAGVAAALDRIEGRPKAYVIDVSEVSVVDSTAASTIGGFVRTAERRRASVLIAGARPEIRRVLVTHGVEPPRVGFENSVAEAVAAARREISAKAAAPPA